MWCGIDQRTDKRVLIRVAASDDDVATTLLEGEALASVSHPNVVRLLDAGFIDDRPCLVLPHVRGRRLSKWLRTVGPLTWFRAFDYGAQVLDGLGALHDQDLIHGNLSPDTLVLGPGGAPRVTIVGFGRVGFSWAAQDEPGPKRSRPCEAFAYKPPEQLGGTALQPGSDIYALGLTLWEAVSGVSAFMSCPGDLQARLSFRPPFDALPPGAPALPPSARFALECMLRPSLVRRESDARLCARRLRAALGIDTAALREETSPLATVPATAG